MTAPIAGDHDKALAEASLSVEQLRSQDEPFWLAAALVTYGALEAIVGRYQDALGHLREGSAFAQRIDSAWLAALVRAQLGIVAVMQRRFDDAWGLLDGALTLSEAAQNTHMVTLCLDAFARLAFAAGRPEPAARLAGVAEGLRRRRVHPELAGRAVLRVRGRGRGTWGPGRGALRSGLRGRPVAQSA